MDLWRLWAYIYACGRLRVETLAQAFMPYLVQYSSISNRERLIIAVLPSLFMGNIFQGVFEPLPIHQNFLGRDICTQDRESPSFLLVYY